MTNTGGLPDRQRSDALLAAERDVAHLRDQVVADRDAHLPLLAAALIDLANRLAGAARWAEGVVAAGESVACFRELAAVDRDAHLPGLALAVHTLALDLVEVGRREEALAAAEESTGYYRELAERNGPVFAASSERAAGLLAHLRGLSS